MLSVMHTSAAGIGAWQTASGHLQFMTSSFVSRRRCHRALTNVFEASLA